MKPVRITAIALVMVITMSAACVCCPDCSSADPADGEYGAAISISSAELDEAFVDITGKTVEQWIAWLSSEIENYDIDDYSLTFDSKAALTRYTDLDGDDYTIKDRITGYIESVFNTTVTGKFPDASTYHSNGGESALAFLYRVFGEEGSETPRTVNFSLDIKLYVDAEAVTRADLSTGDITDSDVKFRFALYDKEHYDIDADIVDDEGKDTMTMTLSYDTTDVDSNFYLDLNAGLTFDGMKVFSGGTWEINPLVTQHITKSLISSDLADSIWLDAIASRGEEDDTNTNLVELILKILGSGGRTLDLFDTIKSLTSTDIPDMAFTASLDASKTTDVRGYDYCKLASKKAGGPAFYLADGPYYIDGTKIDEILPDDIPDEKIKTVIHCLILAFFIHPVEVKDMSGYEALKQQCAEIQDFTEEKLDVEEEESYSIPPLYIGFAAGGILASLALMILMRRHVI